jgi:hypothetical protein
LAAGLVALPAMMICPLQMREMRHSRRDMIRN